MQVLLLWLAFSAQSDDRLIQLLEHRDPKVRTNAAEMLGDLRSQSAVPALIRVVDDENLRVRGAAADALKAITGMDYKVSFADWQDWWDREGKAKFAESVRTPEDVNQLLQPALAKMDEKVHDAKSEIRILSITVAVIGFVFVLVMIFFVGNVSSKLKEWKEVARQTEVYLKEGQEITKRTDKILEELEGKKLEIVEFIGKLKEENQAELDRYSDLVQQNIEHRMREEVMALRQKAEKELEQTLGDRKGLVEHEIRRVVSEQKEKLDKTAREQQERFVQDVDVHTLYLEASFHKANGRHDEALRSYKKVVAIRPDHAVAWTDMGTVLRELMRYDEAVESYQKALEISPDDSSTLYHLAATFAHQRKRNEMLDSLARAIGSDGEYKDEALNDPAFKPFWDDPAFKDIAES